eukprot:CAMPEP_0176385784 /NCGR_PEP_ID=MMETSP0126-20121128/35420_1 /TAXON_ID=141414 ORGANISM="Strombidinopsis acuminatum, Strain SPMC142" /NCGR_SAMPLE_ID=MMETSP0126 /ASSEMBLY_ACC=CAM_ASM_000229 /LENGTH=61 /DNA_ID=CAMNT_0017752339 /DNA_START=1434 /DNA_END=1619 /DNA_ORIENTATION=+
MALEDEDDSDGEALDDEQQARAMQAADELLEADEIKVKEQLKDNLPQQIKDQIVNLELQQL